MRTFAEKSKAAQQTKSSKSTIPAWAHLGQSRGVGSILHLQRAIGNHAVRRSLQWNGEGLHAGSVIPASTCVDHDFNRMPMLPKQVNPKYQAQRASGEIAEGTINQGEEWLPATGDGGTPTDAGVPLPAGVPAASAPASTPRLRKTTVSALSTQNNGGFNWGVRWSIDNAAVSTNGWIVQHVVVRQNVEAWHPPLRLGNTRPIVPGQGGYGGLRESWYPLWEAWQVRGGQVFVGSSTSAHNADTYGQNPVGADTKGTTEVVGQADFYPNVTLPTNFTVRNAAPAWSLPVTNTNPNLTGGTGTLNHNLTATWDGVGGSGTTTATTV